MNKKARKRLKKVVWWAFGCVQHLKAGRNTQQIVLPILWHSIKTNPFRFFISFIGIEISNMFGIWIVQSCSVAEWFGIGSSNKSGICVFSYGPWCCNVKFCFFPKIDWLTNCEYWPSLQWNNSTWEFVQAKRYFSAF